MSEHEGQLGAVRRVYAIWGRHPHLYAAQDWLTFLGRHRRIRRRAVEASSAGPGARVLELACGTGRNFAYIEERIGRSGQLVGFDYSQQMLAAAEKLCSWRGWSNVELVRGDAAELDIGGPPFDAVISVLGLSAIPDHRAALERRREVLRPGGVLSVCDASLFSGALRHLNPLVRAVYERSAAWEPDRNIPEDMRRCFGAVEVERFNFGTFFVARSVKSE
jgi:ubiquinone/menaquinone biosynthesis C-methylase UbiE